MDDTEISLICWIVGLENSNAFPVDILRSKFVGQLKEAIKQENKDALNHVAAPRLEIWKLKNPLSVEEIVGTLETIGARDIPNADKLDPLEELSYYFPKDPVRKKVHLVVQLPYTAETNEDEGPPPKRLKLGGDRSQQERRAKLQTPEYTGPIGDFYRRYWGKPLDPAFTTLPTGPNGLELRDEEGPSGGVLPGDPFLDGINGRYLVRAEYIRAFDKVKSLHDTYRSKRLAVVTGQPGIGKTLWIDYALRRCFGEKQPVIYYLGDDIYFFSDKMKSINITTSNHQYPEYTWCFVDSTAAKELPHHVYNPLGRVFPIYVTSQRRWAKLDQLRKPTLIIMNPWTMAELEKASVLYPDRTFKDISERFDKAGPTARYCLEYTSGELTNLYSKRVGLINWDSIQSIITALLGDRTSWGIADIPHHIGLACRLDSEAVQPVFESDTYMVKPISPFIRKRLLLHLRQSTEADRIAMIKSFTGVLYAGITGMAFETICQERFPKRINITAAPMFRTSSHWHAVFGDYSRKPQLRKACEEFSSTAVPYSLSISPLGCEVYDSGPLTIQENIYYMPCENQVAMDSFIIHAGHLYMFQFTTGQEHSLKDGLLTTLDRFVGLQAVGKQHIIFVVPKDDLFAFSVDFSCLHSDKGFLRDHVPHIAQIPLDPPALV